MRRSSAEHEAGICFQSRYGSVNVREKSSLIWLSLQLRPRAKHEEERINLGQQGSHARSAHNEIIASVGSRDRRAESISNSRNVASVSELSERRIAVLRHSRYKSARARRVLGFSGRRVHAPSIRISRRRAAPRRHKKTGVIKRSLSDLHQST